MIVIADTSPLNYLVLIGEVDILRLLYQRVVIPEGVLRELQHPETPAAVSEWIARRPGWLEVKGATVVSDPVLRLLAARGASGRFGGGQKCVVDGLGKRKGLPQVLAIPC